MDIQNTYFEKEENISKNREEQPLFVIGQIGNLFSDYGQLLITKLIDYDTSKAFFNINGKEVPDELTYDKMSPNEKEEFIQTILASQDNLSNVLVRNKSDKIKLVKHSLIRDLKSNEDIYIVNHDLDGLIDEMGKELFAILDSNYGDSLYFPNFGPGRRFKRDKGPVITFKNITYFDVENFLMENEKNVYNYLKREGYGIDWNLLVNDAAEHIDSEPASKYLLAIGLLEKGSFERVLPKGVKFDDLPREFVTRFNFRENIIYKLPVENPDEKVRKVEVVEIDPRYVEAKVKFFSDRPEGLEAFKDYLAEAWRMDRNGEISLNRGNYGFVSSRRKQAHSDFPTIIRDKETVAELGLKFEYTY